MVLLPVRVAALRLFLRMILFGCLMFNGLTVAMSSEPVVVFAASSLKNALDDISNKWQLETGKKVVISFGSSSLLARQIELGAPADIFISANTSWIAALARRNYIAENSQIELLGNRLVLIGHGKSIKPISIKAGFDLLSLIGDGHLAMGMVNSVPAGIYGKAALLSLGVWDDVAEQTAQTVNVRAALALVARGEAPFGIVYKSDALASDKVSVIGFFPTESHPPIVYPAALVASSSNEDAKSFFKYLKSPMASQLFKAHGFEVLE